MYFDSLQKRTKILKREEVITMILAYLQPFVCTSIRNMPKRHLFYQLSTLSWIYVKEGFHERIVILFYCVE